MLSEIKLNRHQKKHVESLRWLLLDTEGRGGTRRTGRSTLLMLVFIEAARAQPGRSFRFFDHTGSTAADRVLYRSMKDLVDRDPAYSDIKLSNGYVSSNRRK